MIPHGHPDLATSLNNMGNWLRSRYERIGASEDLEDAIHNVPQAGKATPHGHPDLALRLVKLGFSLNLRYERTSALEDLE